MKRLLFITLFFSISALTCVGQTPAPFRQFYFNPYLFNPGYTGINGYTELYLVYRKQWINFNDAPTTIGVNLQYPTKKRVSLAFNITSDEVVVLRNSSAMATFAYTLPLATDQTFRFGISGGGGMNDLNLNEGEYDPNDPTIINAAQNNYYVDGNFGALYTNRGLRLGFAFTRLFNTNSFSAQEFNEVKFSALDHRLYSASYKFALGTGTIAVEPYVLYRQTPDKEDTWEAASTVYFKQLIWGGAAYHQTNGLALFLGMNIKDLLRFSYSYELPPNDNNFVSSSSHELHLSLRLGKKRDAITTRKAKNAAQYAAADTATVAPITEEPVEPVIAETKPAEEEPALPQSPPVDQQPEQQEPQEPVVIAPQTDDPAKDNVAVTTPPAQAETVTPPIKTADSIKTVAPVKTVKKGSKPPRSFSLSGGHYVVAGAFRILTNAMRYARQLQSKGYTESSVALNHKNNLYYVYIFSSYDLEEAKRVRNQYRIRRPFSEVWLFSVE